jgi:hypothetical protein
VIHRLIHLNYRCRVIDDEKLRLENMIRDGIAPRISGVNIYDIEYEGKTLLLIHIPRSWASPHMVSFKGSSRFFTRNSAGKYQLDVGELRSAFSLSESIKQKIHSFRIERLGVISSNEIPMAITDEPKAILHIVPLNSFDQYSSYNLTAFDEHLKKARPLDGSGWNSRYNFDGHLTYSGTEKEAYSYVQIFRNGVVEAVTNSFFQMEETQPVINGYVLERELINSVPRYLGVQKEIGTDPPFSILFSLLNVKGFSIYLDRTYRPYSMDQNIIEKNALLIPDLLIEDYEIDSQKELKPIFDSIWNACGIMKSLNYDEDGNWH